MSHREAPRHFGIRRESVKKRLSLMVPPGYRRSAPVRRPKLDGFTEIIDHWLREDLRRVSELVEIVERRAPSMVMSA